MNVRPNSGTWLVAAQELCGPRVLKLTHIQRAPQPQLTQALEHIGDNQPNILLPESHGIAHSYYYELLEYFPRGSLAQQRESLTDTALTALVKQITSVLQTLHRRSIETRGAAVIHSDIKPSNILVASNTRTNTQFLLTDFHSAVFAEQQGVGVTQYTPKYAAPEVLRTKMVYPASDYWSLGMVIMELYLGAHPLSNLDQSQASSLITRGWDPPFDKITDCRWRALCAGLLQERLEQRWDSADIREWLAGSPSRISRGLELIGDIASDQPFHINGTPIFTADGLARAMLQDWNTELIHDKTLAHWVTESLQRPDIAALLHRVQTTNTSDDLRLLHFCHSIIYSPPSPNSKRTNQQLPAVWRGIEINERNIAAAAHAARHGDHEQLDWLRSLLEGDGFDFHAQQGYQAIGELGQRLTEGYNRYQQAWSHLISHGAPAATRPSETEGLLETVELLCNPTMRTQLRQEAGEFFSHANLLVREPWFLHLGTDLSALNDAELLILRRLERISLITEINIGSLDELGQIDPARLRNSTIHLRSQAALLEKLAIPPSEPIMELLPGDTFNTQPPSSLLERIRYWWASPWSSHPNWSDNQDEDENAPEEIELRVQIVRMLPVHQNIPIQPSFEAYLLRISWNASREWRLRLRITHPARIVQRIRMTTPLLPESGAMTLAVTSDTQIRLIARSGWFRRTATQPITIWFNPNPVFTPAATHTIHYEHHFSRITDPITTAETKIRKFDSTMHHRQRSLLKGNTHQRPTNLRAAPTSALMTPEHTKRKFKHLMQSLLNLYPE